MRLYFGVEGLQQASVLGQVIFCSEEVAGVLGVSEAGGTKAAYWAVDGGPLKNSAVPGSKAWHGCGQAQLLVAKERNYLEIPARLDTL